MNWEALTSIIFVGLLWFVGFITSVLDDREHAYLRMLFIGLGFWIIPMGVNIARVTAIDNSAAAGVLSTLTILYNVVVWLAVFVTAYFAIYVTTMLLRRLQQKREEERYGKV